MGFTKAQRLKGLKKQLKNLGYDVSRSGVSSPAMEDEVAEVDSDARGVKTVKALRAREEAW